MLHSGKARLNHDAQSRATHDHMRQQQMKLDAIRVYEDARYDITIDPRHLETLRIKAYGN